MGFEPTIPGSVGRCLIHWATGAINFRNICVHGCVVKWYDSRSRCERSWVQFPAQPFCTTTKEMRWIHIGETITLWACKCMKNGPFLLVILPRSLLSSLLCCRLFPDKVLREFKRKCSTVLDAVKCQISRPKANRAKRQHQVTSATLDEKIANAT